MVRGIVEILKLPVAYYLLNESFSSEKVRESWWMKLPNSKNIGVVSDIGSNFQNFVREMQYNTIASWKDMDYFTRLAAKTKSDAAQN